MLNLRWAFRVSFTMLVSLSLDAAININVDVVQKSVAFLYAADGNGQVDVSKPLGTGFFVEIPFASDPKHAYRVLVTARHIVDPVWAGCEQPNPETIYARLNKINYNPASSQTGFDFVKLPLANAGKSLWQHHADSHVDAAVLRLTTNLDAFDTATIKIAEFPTPEELASQSIGDPVMSAGLLPGLTGSRRNYPIFKFGQISNIPQEEIDASCAPGRPGFSVRVWLIAANLVAGNSGSPIFHVPLGGSGVSFGGTRPMLLGVQSISFLAADVAGMTPISYVYDILTEMKLNDADLHRGLPSSAPKTPSK